MTDIFDPLPCKNQVRETLFDTNCSFSVSNVTKRSKNLNESYKHPSCYFGLLGCAHVLLLPSEVLNELGSNLPGSLLCKKSQSFLPQPFSWVTEILGFLIVSFGTCYRYVFFNNHTFNVVQVKLYLLYYT